MAVAAAVNVVACKSGGHAMAVASPTGRTNGAARVNGDAAPAALADRDDRARSFHAAARALGE